MGGATPVVLRASFDAPPHIIHGEANVRWPRRQKLAWKMSFVHDVLAQKSVHDVLALVTYYIDG